MMGPSSAAVTPAHHLLHTRCYAAAAHTPHTPHQLLHFPLPPQVLGVGIDEMVKRGKLGHLKDGPLYWVDTADSQPCIGTGGICAWELTASGERACGMATALVMVKPVMLQRRVASTASVPTNT